MEDDEYKLYGSAGLKLKGVTESGIKKKKKKKNLDAKKIIEQVTNANSEEGKEKIEPKATTTKTKAQLAFEKMQEKRQMERVLKKASKTHKQRVEEFNKHLDSLTEHYDIPKVSWTK